MDTSDKINTRNLALCICHVIMSQLATVLMPWGMILPSCHSGCQ